MGRSGPGRIIAIVVSLLITAAVSALLWYWFRDSALMGADSMTTFEPASDNASLVQDIYLLIFWLAGGVFVGVMALTLAFSLMFREQEGVEAVQTHGNSRLEVLWTFIPVIIVVIMAVPTFEAIVSIEGDAPDGALDVLATGHQWWFEFYYPEYDLTTANELHLPVDRPVNIMLESDDVIHSFWAPRLMGKVDMVPGHQNDLWFTPNETGEFLGQCAEFCGLSHANMRFRVYVQSEADFDGWVEAQSAEATPAGDDADELVAQGQQMFSTLCVGCHTARGVPGAVGVIGPDLTHLASRNTIASGTLPNTPEALADWLRDPPAIKPGSLMPDLNLSEEQIEQVVAYLQTLE
ncbi:MAG: cytochrome c oxidase subunit II [Dehalococcoidia bacterium]